MSESVPPATASAVSASTAREVDVSIFVKCYRHAPFIEQAIRSVATQETPYSFEIIVGDDGSDDESPAIIRRLHEELPLLIRPLFRDASEAFFVKSRRSGNANLLSALKQVRGRYVAVLDGDDYWLSPSKLQRQVDLLEDDPTLSAVAHPVRRVDPKGADLGTVGLAAPGGTLTALHLGRGMKPHISSFMARSDRLPLPVWFKKLEYTDWPFMLWMAGDGLVKVLPEELSAYRLHEGGMWSGSSALRSHLRTRNVARAVAAHIPDKALRDQIKKFELYQTLKVAREFRKTGQPARAKAAIASAGAIWRGSRSAFGFSGGWRYLRELARSWLPAGRVLRALKPER